MIPSTQYEWLLFDLDNTLLNFTESSEQAFKTMMAEWHPELHYKEYFTQYKMYNHQVWEARESGQISHDELKTKRWALFFEAMNWSFDPAQSNKRYFEIISQRVDFVTRAKELIEACSRHYQLAIITNGLAEVQRPRLINAQLMPFFNPVIISDEIGFAKPQVEFFEHCHEQLNQPPKDKVLVIGDTLKSDIIGGKAFGYDTCWFNHDYLENDGEIQAHFDIHLLEELWPILHL